MRLTPYILLLGISGCQLGLGSKYPVIEDSGLEELEIDDTDGDTVPDNNTDTASSTSTATGTNTSTETSTETSSGVDGDGDGFDSNEDCNDADNTIYPGANEIANDGIDQDCDGEDYTYGTDADGDGYISTSDCDDNNPDVNPGATDIPDDGIDQDCSGSDASSSGGGSDPFETSCTDGIDNDGNGLTDCDDIFCWFDAACSGGTDADGDGYDSSTDCDDNDASINPGAYDTPSDGIDQDCDGSDAGSSSGGNDPYETSCTDGIDNDSNGLTDCDDFLCLFDAACSSSGTDNDGDGYDDTVDCDDSDASINPGAYDIPSDGIDQDCDGSDAGGGSGTCASSEVEDCNGACAPSNWLGDGLCDNGVYSYGGNYIDLNCASLNYDDGDCSSGGTGTDWDGDGYDSIATGGNDCDDYNSSINPGAYDIPNDGIDQDCDGYDAGGGSSGGCCYTLSMSDSYGDGWNGSYMESFVNGTSNGTHQISTGSSGSEQICMASGDSFMLDFVSVGIYDYEISYELLDPNGLSVANGSSPFAGTVYTDSNVCP